MIQRLQALLEQKEGECQNRPYLYDILSSDILFQQLPGLERGLWHHRVDICLTGQAYDARGSTKWIQKSK